MEVTIYEMTEKQLISNSLSKAVPYKEYRNLITQLAEEGKSTGARQTEALINYTQLNDRRMKRWDKTLKFSEDTINQISKIQRKMTWLVLVESWCGDASPALPVMHKIAELNTNISLKIVLRDENVDLMNRFLTDGNRSIPKLIVLDSETEQVLGDWGPRSSAATKLVEAYKSENGKLTPEFKQDLQVWYNKDKGQSILSDLLPRFLLK